MSAVVCSICGGLDFCVCLSVMEQTQEKFMFESFAVAIKRAADEWQREIVAWLRQKPEIVEECCHRGCGCFPVGTERCPSVDENGKVCGRGLMSCEESRPETRTEIADALERGDWRKK
jgi:hypothetical protein